MLDVIEPAPTAQSGAIWDHATDSPVGSDQDDGSWAHRVRKHLTDSKRAGLPFGLAWKLATTEYPGGDGFAKRRFRAAYNGWPDVECVWIERKDGGIEPRDVDMVAWGSAIIELTEAIASR